MPESSHSKHTDLPKVAAPAGVKRPSGVTAAMIGADAKAPEWKTEAWKRHVEAEARNRLKDRIHDVGARR